jgi:competence protein ComFC
MFKTITKPTNKTIVLINKGYNFVYEYLFPKFCVGCGVEGTFLCQECEQKILPVATQVCPDCGRISEHGLYCELCRYDITYKKVPGKKKPVKIVKRKPLQGIITAAYYEEGPIREIIHHFKYNSVTELSDVLVRLLSDALLRCHCEERSDAAIYFDIVTFTPLHFRRLAERGYNQAEILAKGLGISTKLSVIKLLTKTKKTQRQVVLQGARRRKNLQGVFKIRSKYQELSACRQGRSIKGKNILIIDDISTTGATLNESAKVLKEAGAKKVWGLVVARG